MVLMSGLCALGLAGPAHAERAPRVEVSLVGIDSASVGLRRTEIVVRAEVTRHRGLPIHLRWLDHRISIGDAVVSERRTSLSGTRVRRGQSAEVAIPLSFDTSLAAGALTAALRDGRLDIAIDGKAGVRVWLLPLSFDYGASLADVRL